MYISQLRLTNFRSFQAVEVALSRGVNIISGFNAQGKTTILEAIYLLAIAKSFRAQKEREVVYWQTLEQGGSVVVDGTIFGPTGQIKLLVGYQIGHAPTAANQQIPGSAASPSIRKDIKVGGVARTATDLIGLFNAVLFSADDVSLVQGSPVTRRKFLDILISQSNSLYLTALLRYRRIIYQRNRLLRLIRENTAAEAELEFWDRELAKEGAYIVQQRLIVMSSLSNLAREILLELTNHDEDLQINYQTDIGLDKDIKCLQGKFLHMLSKLRQRDLSLGVTSTGPHRDNFTILVNERSMESFSSRGQARTLALTLRLSEAAYLTACKGAPIVLLDDILSELDAKRRDSVLEMLGNYDQSIITTTDIELFAPEYLASATEYEVDCGTITRKSRNTG